MIGDLDSAVRITPFFRAKNGRTIGQTVTVAEAAMLNVIVMNGERIEDRENYPRVPEVMAVYKRAAASQAGGFQTIGQQFSSARAC